MERDCVNRSERLASLPKDNRTLFWEKYLEEAETHDKHFLDKHAENMQSVLIFSGLFSAVAASFLNTMKTTLSPNPTDTTNTLLMMLVHASNTTAFPNQIYTIPPWTGPRSDDVWSQAIGYAGLSASLLAALGAVLGKQWLIDFTRLRRGPPQERGRRRQQMLDGLKKWRFEVVMGAIPALIQLALLLFGIALSINLWELNHAVGSILVVATALGVLVYLYFTISSLLSPTCPFHTPISESLTIQDATVTVMKAFEGIARYWARVSCDVVRGPLIISPVNRLLAYLPVLLASPLLIIFSIMFAILSVAGSPVYLLVVVTHRLQSRGGQRRLRESVVALIHYLRSRFITPLRRRFYYSMIRIRDSSHRIQASMRRVHHDEKFNPTDSDSRSIAWVLETSTQATSLMAAAMLVPEMTWPDDLDVSLPTHHLCNMFIHSIPETTGSHDNALQLGKAFLIMLCQMSDHVSASIWQGVLPKLQRFAEKSKDHDLTFILTVATKLLRIRLKIQPREVDSRLEGDVSPSLLAWFLQPLQSLIHLEESCRLPFFPEAHVVFKKLRPSEISGLSAMQQVQYLRIFRAYISAALKLPMDDIPDPSYDGNEQQLVQCQVDILKQIFGMFKQATSLTFQRTYSDEHFVIPVTVLCTLLEVTPFEQALSGEGIESWAMTTFNAVVHRAHGSDQAGWLLGGSLLQLASQAHESVDGENQRELTSLDRPEEAQAFSSLTIDFDSILRYLLNKAVPATPEQVAYAFRILLANKDALVDFVSHPDHLIPMTPGSNEQDTKIALHDFIDYLVNTTSPKQLYSVLGPGRKVLFMTCDSLLRAYPRGDELVFLASRCNLSPLIRRSFLYQDPPSILIYLLQENHDVLNDALRKVLIPVLARDPFNTLLSKLRNDPSYIPERDLQDFEITLVLARNEQTKFSAHLDLSIDVVQRTYSHEMALPFAVIIGWLLRPNGPMGSSPGSNVQLLRPGLEELLVPAWRASDMLEDNPQMLHLLVTCTTEWLSLRRSSSSPAKPLTRLEEAIAQLTTDAPTLSSDITRALSKIAREIKELKQRISDQESGVEINPGRE